ncbi:ras association domain-containing protein 1 isoform X2 [Python bivittatus]|uniref:Ras association domain-containing protein 1 isoform X2 n=1 Tax=Python bivittatus TaxID=176946 RepID=A0A9F5IN21_PYTBI|nr:ras association domain-containing protein 1 isoform X2 [Python bivittatus]
MNRSADQEMIELKNLGLEEQLDLTRGSRGAAERPVRLERANALRISPGKVPEILTRVRQIRLLGGQTDPKLTEELGEGHLFRSCTQSQPTWCDLCGEFIWGVYKKRLRCIYCKFICHYRCRALIRLDCRGPRYKNEQNEGNEQTIEKDTNVDEQVDWEKPILSQAEIEQKIKEYNSQINSNLFMSLDTIKHLHIISRTRASEVIEALLKKFMVVDNPRKFALFERTEKDDQVYIRKLSDEEQPLRLRLLAGPSEKTLSFVLKENETGEVNWDAFSMPELQNFLRILQREEEEHTRQILQKYAHCRQKMQEALTARTPG